MYLVGIDENGFGPVLGPLNVTGVLFEVERYEHNLWEKLNDVFSRKFSQKNRFKLTDSKQMTPREWEKIALILYFLLFKEIPRFSSTFLKKFILKEKSLVKKCGEEEKNMCWEPDFSLPLWEERNFLEEIPPAGKRTKDILEREKIRILALNTLICCPYNFNFLLQVYNKAELNLYLFETLIKYYYQKYRGEFLFICGKIGGIKYYHRYFKLLNKYHCLKFSEKDELSEYHFENLGKVSFIKDGDENYFPISLSSIIGKYIREIFMRRINTYFSSRVSGLPYVSGYRDKFTKEFIKRVEGELFRLNISPLCFRRQK